METASTIILAFIAIAAFVNFREGTMGDWLRAKFLNAGEPPRRTGNRPTTPGTPTTDALNNVLDQVGAGDGTEARFGVFTLRRPVGGPTISGWGAPRDGGARRHKGIDIGAPTGTPIVAARSGRVASAGTAGKCGKRVRIEHGEGWATVYCHLDQIAVRTGVQVTVGATIGTVGTTGNATGGAPHLHFEVHRNGNPIDPATVNGVESAMAGVR